MCAADISRNSAMLELIDDYLDTTGKSARWLGIVAAKDPRLVPNLRRGQEYPARIMLGLLERLMVPLLAQREQEIADIEEMEAALCSEADFIRHDLPASSRGLLATWRHISTILKRQRDDPDYQYISELPFPATSKAS